MIGDIYENNLQYFKISKRYKDKAQCVCPAHDDKQASLTISRGKKCTLFHCHAGCSTDKVLRAAGLDLKETFYETLQQKAAWIGYVERVKNKKIQAVYNYVSIVNGSYAFTKLRFEGKDIAYGILNNDEFKFGLGRDNPRKALKAIYGSLEAIKKAITEGTPIFIPEGEKDVDTLTRKGYTAFTYGGVSDWQADFTEILKGADVCILADNDAPGKKVADTIKNDLKDIAKSVRIIVPVPEVAKADITDFFEAGHTKEEFEQLLNTEIGVVGHSIQEVKEMLSYNVTYDNNNNVKSKKVNKTVRNFEIILDNDNRFAGKIKFDEFSQQAYLVGDVPWETKCNYRAWSSYDDSALYSILQADYGISGREDFYDALKNVCRRSTFHPVKEVLDSLKWDGEEHIKDLLTDYLGAENTAYTQEVIRLFMLGAVKRIYNPGCKFDYTMILQGKQGLGKSSFLQLLALNDSWFNDSLDSLDSDKSAQSLMGSWIIELAELKSLARTAGGVDSVKRFLTATQDKYRVPYERRADIFLRQCVFAGTTNKSDFLQDETGNRRFLIIQTGAVKPKKNLFSEEAVKDIRSAWAQAVHIYKNENPILVLSESHKNEAERLQAESMTDDGKTGMIEEYLRDKLRTCAIELWQEALGEQGRPQKWQATEINSIVENMGEWERMKSPYKFKKYGNQRGFQRKNNYNAVSQNTTNSDSNDGFMSVTNEELAMLPFD